MDTTALRRRKAGPAATAGSKQRQPKQQRRDKKKTDEEEEEDRQRLLDDDGLPPVDDADLEADEWEDEEDDGGLAQLMQALASSAGDGGAPDDFMNEPEPTPEERRALKAKMTKEWASTLPTRVRRFVSHGGSDEVTMRIFREFLIRLPMVNAGKQEVLSLCEGFGNVEYVGPLHASTSKDAVSVDTDHCHILRFDDGIDAVRCFFALNGAVIDPQQYNAAVEQLMLALSAATKKSNEAVEVDTSAATRMFQCADSKSDPNALIFVSCDFFRVSFPNVGARFTRGNEQVILPSRVSLVSGMKGSRGNKKASSPKPSSPGLPPPNPMLSLARDLADRSHEFSNYYPLVQSYVAVSWQRFCVAVNLIHFVFTVPSANDIMCAIRRQERLSQEQVEKRLFGCGQAVLGNNNTNGNATSSSGSSASISSWHPSAVTIAHEGLKRNELDIDLLIRKADRAASALEVCTGVPAKEALSERISRAVYKWLVNMPMSVVVLLFLILCLLITILLFLLLSK